MTFPLLYLFFSYLIILSTLIGSFTGLKVIINDFFEIYKVLVNIGIYLITLSVVKSKQDKIIILKFMTLCLLISVLISVQQYFNLFNINEKYVHIIAPTQYRTLINNYPYPRVIGMTSNPNEYSVMPGIGAIISWSMYSITRKKRNLIYMFIFIIGVLMTLSRSGFIFMATGLVAFTFLYSIKLKGKINIKIIRFLLSSILLLVLFSIVIFIYLPEELTWRLIAGFDIQFDNSFQARLSNWKEHIHYFQKSPWLGLGPAKSIDYIHHVDNEWLLFLRRYGVIGCSYIVITFIYPFIRSKDKFLKSIYFATLAGSALYMIPAIIYHSFQVMPLMVILAALVSVESKKQIG